LGQKIRCQGMKKLPQDIQYRQREILSQMKQQKPKTYFVYFEVSVVHSCGKRSTAGA